MKDAARLALLTGTGAIAAGAARGAYRALRRYPPAGEQTWSRTNHRGEPVTLLEGAAVTAGAVTAQVIGQVVPTAVAARRASSPASAPGRPERVVGAIGPVRQSPRPSQPARVTVNDIANYSPWSGPGGRARGALGFVRQVPGVLPVADGTVNSSPWSGRGVVGFGRRFPGFSGPAGGTVNDIANYSFKGAGRGELAIAVAGLGGLAFGVLDDLRGSAKRRGLRGHLGALAHGEVTTGTVKLAGLAATGLAAALLEGGDPADVAINAGLIAGGANLLNLFDLRPGRAIKVAALSAALIAAGGAVPTAHPRTGAGRLAGLQAVAAPLGSALALLPEDLGERAMLGDAGANALGAMLGAAAARTLPRGARAGLLAGIVTLTVASEKVSFTKVIAASPPLNWLDMLGRRPASTPLAAPLPGDAATGGRGLADPDPAWVDGAARRRQPGRHRRVATTVRGNRSASWFSIFRKTVARREP